jgi:GntR family transcriptional repressor for pyruvate dehydrogenase complex
LTTFTDQIHELKFSRESLHERIATELQNMIAENNLAPGTRLPSERELADSMGVSRVTLHQSMLVLEQRGLVSIKVGTGVFVENIPSQVVTDSIHRFCTLGACLPEHLVAFREILEPETAAMAARNATTEELAEMGRLVEKMELAMTQHDFAMGIAADSAFHEVLAQASHNDLVVAVASGLAKAIHAQIESYLPEAGVRTHRPVFEAVASRNPARAREAMRSHMELTRSQMLSKKHSA